MNLLFLFFIQIFSYRVTIKPNSKFEVEQTFAKGDRFKLEYQVESHGNALTELRDPRFRMIGSFKEDYNVMYSEATEEGPFSVIFYNVSRSDIKVYFVFENVLENTIDPYGGSEFEVLENFERALKENINSQSKHISRQEKHNRLAKKSKKWVRTVMIFEAIFSMAMIYFLHKQTIRLFDKKTRV
ncbi:hypothetical protein TCON_1683 [Astathelohania contejeani]|uniref:GOLD domain-containing protein n=1 Tax=Astathelohania contejeani TaxID=164912 RepID=A0ABQ7HY81_9MICR|nr:hypothetical protein TCON_1683 [Thelohania contejeani]